MKASYFLKFSILTVLITCGILPTAVCSNNSAALYHDLFDNYTPVRPATSWYETVRVTMQFSLFQIKSLDGKSQLLETTGQLLLVWYDPALSWDPLDYGYQLYTEVDAKMIWTPVVGLRNSADKVVDPDWKTFPCLIYASGVVIWAPTGSFKSSCDLNMYKFPFDTQICSLDFGNLVHTEYAVQLYTDMDSVLMSFFVPSKEFRVTGTHTENASVKFDVAGEESEQLSVVKFHIHMERLPAYYLLNIIVPTVVLAFLSAFTFYVPVDSGEKLSLAITILLSFSVFLLILSDNTPKVSQNLPFLAIYLTMTICISAVSMVVQMIILNVYHKAPLAPVPEWLKRTMRYLTCQCGTARVTDVHKSLNEGSSKTSLKCVDFEEDHQSKSGTSCNDGILDKTNVEKMASRDTEEAMREEWKIVARLMDRIFFIIFILVQITLIIATFGIIPFV